MRKIRKRTMRAVVAFGLIAALLAGGSVATFAANKTISRNKAKTIVLNDAGVKKSSVNYWSIKLDYDDGTQVYDIDFKAGAYKYEYELNAGSGRIRSYEREKVGKTIGQSKAKKIVLKHAKVKNSSVKSWKIELDIDYGTAKYELEFKTGKYKYEYEINARTGKILRYKKERYVSNSSRYIGVDKAKKIALKHAGVTGQVTYMKAKLEKDHGVYYYDIEFRKGRVEYEYEIHAKTGKILEWDIDWDD